MNLIEANRIAHDVLVQYNVQDTVIEWDNSRSRLGVCQFSKNRYTGHIKKRIVFSRVLFRLLSDSEQMDTIWHEIAHARLPHTAAHGPQWQAIHRSMGGNGMAEYRSTATVRAAAKWLGECRVDQRVISHRNRLTEKTKASLICTCHRQPIRWRQMA